MKTISILKNFFIYYKNLSILKKFLIPSFIGFIFFLLFYIYVLYSTTLLKNNVFEINTKLIPIYEITFENEILLEKISNELNNATIAKELEWIKNSEHYANKLIENLKKFKESKYHKELDKMINSFDAYFKEATILSRVLIVSKDDYERIHQSTHKVVKMHQEVLDLFKNFRENLKNDIKNNTESSYSSFSKIAFNSSYLFFIWIILSSLGLLYIYRDMKLKINQIVKESEEIAKGEVHFYNRLTFKSQDELGSIINSVNLFIDKLDKNHSELESVKNDMKRFIEDTAHQIRTPLSNILINSEMIRENQKDSSSDALFDSIDASINMLSNSYEDLLYISSFETIEYAPKTICLSKTLNSRINFFKNICKVSSKPILNKIEADIKINMNPTECERLIDNNISNAIKYAHIDETLTINLYNIDNNAILEFRSYSKEIKDKYKIFEKNYREDDSQRGLGLGLNMVKTICIKNKISYVVEYKNKQNIFTYTFKIDSNKN